MSSWRDRCRPVIARVLKATAGKPEKEIRAALREAYPFGERAMHPYKVWLDEIKRQRKLKPPRPHLKKPLPADPPDERQLELFEGT